MAKLKLGALEDDKPVKVTSNFKRVFTAIFAPMLRLWRNRTVSRLQTPHG